MTDPEKQIKFQSGATIDLVGTDKPETYCGIEPIVTGPLDPWWKRGVCPAHDEHFTKLDKGEYATLPSLLEA